MDQNQKDEWRKAATATINKDDPNKLAQIIRRVNQLIRERRNKAQKKAAAAE